MSIYTYDQENRPRLRAVASGMTGTRGGGLCAALSTAVFTLGLVLTGLALSSPALALTSSGQTAPSSKPALRAAPLAATCASSSDVCTQDGFVAFQFKEDDPSLPCTFNQTEDWGDGTVHQTPDIQDGQIVSHQYVQRGVYTVHFTGNGSSTDPNTTCTFHPATFVVEFPVNSNAAGTLQFSSARYQVGEAGGNTVITVTRTGGSRGAVSVAYTTTSGSNATEGVDYTFTSGSLNWAAGDMTAKTFSVPIINDTDVEGNETVNVALSNPNGDVPRWARLTPRC